jgi:hypothetical protein
MPPVIIEYSKHLETRLKLRGIDRHLPRRIFDESQARYLDCETGYGVAVMSVQLAGKTRDVMIAYENRENAVTIITIHPLKAGQVDNRVAKGRWRAT